MFLGLYLMSSSRGEYEHEHEEVTGAAKEVPDVVPDHQQLVSFNLDFNNKLTRRST